MAAILVIEDDEQMAHRLFGIFFSKGHMVAVAHRNSKPATLQHSPADLVVFDLDGWYGDDGSYQPWPAAEMGTRPPVLFLAGSRVALKGLHCYNPAWDDYLTKPLEVTEVESRAEALLRRYQMWRETSSKVVLRVGSLSLDVRRGEARVNGQVIPLTTTEFGLLRRLMSSAGEVVSSERLLRDVWGYRTVPGGRELVRAHIKNLRAKIGFFSTDPFTIVQTIPRHGYIVRKDAANYM